MSNPPPTSPRRARTPRVLLASPKSPKAPKAPTSPSDAKLDKKFAEWEKRIEILAGRLANEKKKIGIVQKGLDAIREETEEMVKKVEEMKKTLTERKE